MTKSSYVVVHAQHGVAIDPETGKSLNRPADPYGAVWAEGENEEEAARSTGLHFVHVYPDKGDEEVTHEVDGVAHKLAVRGRPATEKKSAKPS